MYTKSRTKLTNKIHDITRYFESYDLGNSLLFRELPKLRFYGKTLIKYNRYDLISQEVYKDNKYSWILLIYSGIKEEDLQINTFLKYPSLDDVQDLIIRLDEIK